MRRFPASLCTNLCSLLTAAGCALVMAGCQSITSSTTKMQIRVIHASAGTGPVDVTAGGSGVSYNVGFGTATNYTILPPGTQKVNVVDAGTTTSLGELTASLTGNEAYTVLLGYPAPNPSVTILQDGGGSEGAPGGSTGLRFIQESALTGGVDIYVYLDGTKITTAKPLLSAVPLGQVSQYNYVPAGSYDIAITAAGSSKVLYTSAAQSLAGSTAKTVVVLDSTLTSSPQLKVLIANDQN